MEISIWKKVSYASILGIICICSFLIAKFILRMNIRENEIPIDTSTRLY